MFSITVNLTENCLHIYFGNRFPYIPNVSSDSLGMVHLIGTRNVTNGVTTHLIFFYIIIIFFVIPGGLLCDGYLLLKQNFQRDLSLKPIHLALCTFFLALHLFHAVCMSLIWCPFGDYITKSFNEAVEVEKELKIRNTF